MADKEQSLSIKLGGALARRRFAAGLWRERGSVGGYFAFIAVWMALFCAAWWASKAVGLGEQWSVTRMAVSCAGAAGEVFLALLMPLMGLLCSDEEYGPHGYGGHGRYGCYGGGCMSYGSSAKSDAVALALGCAVGAVFLALDLARFAAPWMSWAPPFVNTLCGAVWFLMDTMVASVAGSVWVMIGVLGVIDIHKSSTSVGVVEFSALERGLLDRTCSGARRSAARRL